MADYRHVAALGSVKNLPDKQRLVADFVGLLSKVEKEAPPQIAPAAHLYFSDVATILRAVNAAGLNATKVKSTFPGELFKSPQFQSAGRQVLAFSSADCHYTIGGAG